MPREVDVAERRALIAEATLRVGRRDGVDATTLRAVAKELGRSTVYITNYVGSRVELLMNALAHVEAGWSEELAVGLAELDGLEALRKLLEWSTMTSEQDRAVRQMWLEILSRPSMPAELRGAVRLAAAGEQVELADAAVGAGLGAQFGDVLFLVLRGFYTASVEDPDVWTSERVRRALDSLLGFATDSDGVA
jgi:AcrR family transcriptional regulator